jgi:sugar/nucleoside kinase (ribokinase family)/ubiquinone/menaquinone biosynthesis C-methylase UbiE
MSNTIEQERLLSHAVSPQKIESLVSKLVEKPYASIQRQIELIDELSQFDFGRYLLENQGINGYWTHYMLTHPWFGGKTGKNNRGELLSKMEHFVLEKAPLMLATQQRFQIFLTENQKQVKEHAKLASIPCGMMNELLYLNFEHIKEIQLIGIDYDASIFHDARLLAEQKGLLPFVKLFQQDAWQLHFHDEFDLISSNGLTIYEQDDAKIVELFQQFHRALKPGGKLVTSFLTPPPTLADHCEWNMSAVNMDDLLLQKILFVDIIASKFQCYRSTEQTRNQLTSIGYEQIEFCVGGATIDYKLKSITSLEFFTSNPVTSFTALGGVAHNVALNLACLTKNVGLQCVVGNDNDGYRLLSHAQNAGIDTTSSLTLDNKMTSRYYAILDSLGEMQIGLADMEIAEFTSAWNVWDSESIIFIDTNLPTEILQHAITLSVNKGLCLCIDPVSIPKTKKLPTLLNGVFLIKPDRFEAATLSDMPVTSPSDCIKAGEFLLKKGVQNVVISLGEMGYVIVNETYQKHFPALPVDFIIDVSGAGDAFMAGIIFELSQNNDIVAACQTGAAAAVLALQSSQTVTEAMSIANLIYQKNKENAHATIF